MNPTELEYAVDTRSRLVSIFEDFQGNYIFLRTATRQEALDICQLERSMGNINFLIFPIGMIPSQVWQLLNK